MGTRTLDSRTSRTRAAGLVREGGADASGGLGLDQLLEHARSHGPDKLDTLGRT